STSYPQLWKKSQACLWIIGQKALKPCAQHDKIAVKFALILISFKAASYPQTVDNLVNNLVYMLLFL
ncbi:MAG: hypothetical protein ACLSX2_01355, partial [Christensenellaceae bacterium]